MKINADAGARALELAKPAQAQRNIRQFGAEVFGKDRAAALGGVPTQNDAFKTAGSEAAKSAKLAAPTYADPRLANIGSSQSATTLAAALNNTAQTSGRDEVAQKSADTQATEFEARNLKGEPRVYTAGDIDAVLKGLGAEAGDDNFDAAFDFDEDGTIGLQDLNWLLSTLSNQ